MDREDRPFLHSVTNTMHATNRRPPAPRSVYISEPCPSDSPAAGCAMFGGQPVNLRCAGLGGSVPRKSGRMGGLRCTEQAHYGGPVRKVSVQYCTPDAQRALGAVPGAGQPGTATVFHRRRICEGDLLDQLGELAPIDVVDAPTQVVTTALTRTSDFTGRVAIWRGPDSSAAIHR